MAVYMESEGDVGVAESFTDNSRADDPSGQELGRVGVAESV